MFKSQAGQDRFVYALAVEGEGRRHGTFLDVGCNDPVNINNTYFLESIGWRGLLVDCESSWSNAIAVHRTSPFACADAKTFDWALWLKACGLESPIDYLSFDLDADGLEGLTSMPLGDVRFRIMTVEHDAYRFGDGPRSSMRALLRGLGYALLCPDVTNDGCPFEDWWVDPKTVDMAVAEKFRTQEATDWRKIVDAR